MWHQDGNKESKPPRHMAQSHLVYLVRNFKAESRLCKPETSAQPSCFRGWSPVITGSRRRRDCTLPPSHTHTWALVRGEKGAVLHLTACHHSRCAELGLGYAPPHSQMHFSQTHMLTVATCSHHFTPGDPACLQKEIVAIFVSIFRRGELAGGLRRPGP